MDDLVGRSLGLGQYRLLSVIGRGAIATVYEAEHTGLHLRVAVKVLDPSLTRQKDFAARFQHEVNAIVQLEHPHILPVYESGQEDELLYLVMFLAKGGTLETRLRTSEPPPWQPSRVVALAQQILPALDAAHREGILHGDVRAANILLHAGRVFLADFGLARLVQGAPDLAGTESLAGRPESMSSDQVQTAPFDGRPDLYAFGLVLYELFVGHVPANLPAPTEVNPDLPTPFGQVLGHALAKERNRQYATGAAFLAALLGAGADAAASAPAPIAASESGPADQLLPIIDLSQQQPEAERPSEHNGQRQAEEERRRLAVYEAQREADEKLRRQSEELEGRRQAERERRHQAALEMQRLAAIEQGRQAKLAANLPSEPHAPLQTEFVAVPVVGTGARAAPGQATAAGDDARRRDRKLVAWVAGGILVLALLRMLLTYGVGGGSGGATPTTAALAPTRVAVVISPGASPSRASASEAQAVTALPVTKPTVAQAASPSSRVPTTAPAPAALSSSRAAYTVTVLVSGKVLIVGGKQGSVRLASAELFDPTTNTWTSAGSLDAPRSEHTATLLVDGRVLVVGGQRDDATFLSTVQIYDPPSNSWSTAAALGGPRAYHTATLLRDRRVLIVGGSDSNGLLATAEVYDAPSNSWTLVPPMNERRSHHSATLLANARVLVAGGFGSERTAAIFDPSNNTWTRAGSMTTGRLQHTATLLADERVLVAGGNNSATGTGPHLTSAEIYDPSKDTWVATGSMSNSRSEHAALLLPGGQVLVAGGWDGKQSLASVERYDPTAESWAPGAPMTVARSLLSAILLRNGQVLVAGGANGTTAVASVERYDPAADNWIASAP